MNKSLRDYHKKDVDAFFKSNNTLFRIRSCGIIIKDEKVLMVKNDVDDYFYSVGGAIKIGETIEEGCLREVMEETGYPYEIERLVFVHEVFLNHKDNLWHEIAFYFLMKDSDNDQFIKSIGAFGATEDKVWLPIKSLKEYKAFPEFFASELLNLPTHVKHITTFEN